MATRFLRAAAVVAAAAGLTGCSPPVGDATGAVTYNGKPVVCGAVVFVGPDGMTKTAKIEPTGTYQIKKVGAGVVQVAVVSDDPARPLDNTKMSHGKDAVEGTFTDDSGKPAPPPTMIANPPADKSNWSEPNVDRSKWFPLPAKYGMVHTSGLTVTLAAGPNAGVNLDLK